MSLIPRQQSDRILKIHGGCRGLGEEQHVCNFPPGSGRSDFGAGHTCMEKGPSSLALCGPFAEVAVGGWTGSEATLGV